MDVRQLRYFVKIVDYGSLGKAAEHLYIAQPSLSQQVARLEAELGVSLLLRSPRGVKPTVHGQALYRHARQVLRQMEQLRQEVKEGAGAESGTVALGLPTTMASVLAMPLFERVQSRYPGIRLQFLESMSGYLGELLANGRLDLAILFRESETPGVSARPVLDETLYVMGEPGMADDRPTCALRELNAVRMVAPGAANGLRMLIERLFSRESVDLNIVADIDSLPTLMSIAHSRAACTILPRSALALCDASRRPRVRRLTDPVVTRPASVCWPNALALNAATVAVRQAMLDLIQELALTGAWEGIALRDPPNMA